MEKNGLIKKKKASNGGNRVIASLTKEGEYAFKVSKKRESLHRIFSALTKTQRKQLRDCLKTLWVSALKEKEHHLPLIFPFE
jgi:DNA-binding MarR family transcriptional regulator